jgi:hypothetical protein
MSKQTINVGSTELAGDGESIRSAFVKANSNFTELYTQVPLATSATYAMSFNTSTLVAIAVTATYAQSYDPAPVFTYLAATTSSQYVGRAVTATYAQSFNTATVVGRSVTATNIVNGTWTLSLSTAGSILINGTVFSTLINGTWTVSLSTSGNLTLPTGGLIRNGYPGPAGGSGDGSSWFVAPTSGGGVASPDGKQYIQVDNVGLFLGTNYTTSTGYQWTFGNDGSLKLPAYGVIRGSANTHQVNIVSSNYNQLQWTTPEGAAEIDPNSTSSLTNWLYVDRDGVSIETNRNSGNGFSRWNFGTGGRLLFPDNTQQSTAYLGTASTLINGTWTTSLSSSGTVFLPKGLQTASTGTLDLFTNYSSGNINIGGISPTINMGGGQVNIGYLNTRIVFGYSGVLTPSTTFTNLTGSHFLNRSWSNVIATSTNGNGGPQNGNPVYFNVIAAGASYVSVQQSFYNQGQNYAVGDTITIAGTQLGGFSPANDLTFTIATEVGNTYPNLGPGSLVFDYGLGQFFGYVQTDSYTNLNWTRLDNTSSSTLINGNAIVSLSTAGTLTITGTAIAVSTQTGALQVTGGVGIGGNLYVGGEIVAQKLTIQYTTVTTTLVQTDDIISTYNTTASTSTNTGALQIAGGVGIGGGMFVGGSVTATNFILNGYQVSTSTGGITSPYSGIFTITNTTSSISTNTGALQVAGGVGVAGTMTIGGTVGIGTAVNTYTQVMVYNATTASLGLYGGGSVAGGSQTANIYLGDATFNTGARWNQAPGIGALYDSAPLGGVMAGLGLYTYDTVVADTRTLRVGINAYGHTTVYSTASSASTSTGALQVRGGVGIVGGVFVGGSVTATNFVGVASSGTTSTTAAALGYIGMPQTSTATSYTLVAGDQGKHIYISATGQTITIPANATVPFPIGSTVAFIAGPSATTVSIAITTDTMYLGGSGTTGTRTLAAYGMATAVKVTTSTWFINGSGLT